MVDLNRGRRVWWITAFAGMALGGLALAACGNEQGGGSQISGGGSGGAGGATGVGGLCLSPPCATGGMGLCLAPNCQDGTVKIGGVVGSACVADCGARYSSAWRQDSTGWSRTSHYVDGLKLYVSGTGPAVDGQETAVSFAIYRVAGESELAGHWICATGGTIVPYQYSSDSPMDQPFTLTGLSDLGPCTGDAANTDVLTLNLNGASSTVSGSALGQSVGFVGSSPFCTPYDCDLNVDRLSQFAGSLFTILTENPNNTGSPVPLDDAIWLGPRSLDVDAICGGPASTVTRAADASFTTALIEFRELQGMRCPGTPIEGTLTGSF